ncbi:MAG: hypothetical protein Fur005_13370 [Roseiflexaceae bacterium]
MSHNDLKRARTLPAAVQLRRWVGRAVAAWVGAFLWRNWSGLIEAAAYGRDLLYWQPERVRRVERHGPFGILYDLVEATNIQRCSLIQHELAKAGVAVQSQPVPGADHPNLLVRYGPQGPLTLFVAHYDKSRETPTYQAACDNSAAVAVLLALVQYLAADPVRARRPIGVLFSAAEERGLLGSQAFLAHAQATGIAIAEVINCDMLGRDRIAIRPSARSGVMIDLPLFGWVVYDGRQIQHAEPYSQPDAALVARLQHLAGRDLVVYRRFTATSDSNIYQAAGIPTVALSSSNMAYLDRIWERDSDRIELLDQAHLERALHVLQRVCM